MSADEGGFLARWARRKADARRGGEIAAVPPVPPTSPASPAPGTTDVAAPPLAAETAQARRTEHRTAAAPPPMVQAPPPPTLDDVAALTRDSDYARFVAGDVAPGVRNAAMRKLFSDPRFNVMDGLDVYIDDYGKPDPLPAGMLRQLAQSRLLGLFGDPQPAPPTDASSARPAAAPPETPDEDPDLRLQPDDAAGCEPGEPHRPGAGGDAAGER